MTLDEGIIHAEDVARNNHEAATYLADEHPTQAEKCEACAEEHRQLAEWLKELKAYKEQSGDAVSKQAVAEILLKYAHTYEGKAFAEFLISQINNLPSVTPQHSDAEIQKIQEMEQAEIQKAYELGKAEMQPCEDAISRQAVLDMLNDIDAEVHGGCGFMYNHWMDYIERLPSVTPQPKIGRWIRVDKDKLKCSECDVIHFIAQYPQGKIAFCPNCGAKMEVEE